MTLGADGNASIATFGKASNPRAGSPVAAAIAPFLEPLG